MTPKSSSASKARTTRITNLNANALRKIMSRLPARNVARTAAVARNLRTVAKPAANAHTKRARTVVGKAFASERKFVAQLRPMIATIKAGLETRLNGGMAGLGWEDLDEATIGRMEARVPSGAQVDSVDDSVYVSSDGADTQFEVELEPFVPGRRVYSFPCSLIVIGRGGTFAEKAVVAFTPRFDTAKGAWSVLTWTPKTGKLANGTKNATPSPFGWRVAGALRIAADDVFKRANAVRNFAAQAERVSAAPPKRKRSAPGSAPAKKSPPSAAKKSATARPAAKKAKRVPLPPLKLWNTYKIGSWTKRR